MTTRHIKTALLVLSASFLLASCDSIEALPQNYEDAIVANSEDGKDVNVYENVMGEIWDAISSNKADKVLEEFLKIVSKDQFGSWEEIQEAVDDETKTSAFITAHKNIYVRESDTVLAGLYNTTVDAIQTERLMNFKSDIEDRINEVFYNEIKSGSYSKDNMFYEEKLAYAHYFDLYDIEDIADKDDWYVTYLTPELKKEDVSSFIHLDGRYDDYINRKIIPQIFKDKLVEEYLYNNNYSTLGRAYARKVNIIKLTREDKYKAVPGAMMEKYVETRIEDSTAASSIDFEELANAWRGFSGLTANGLIANPTDPTKPAGTVDTDGNYTATLSGDDGILSSIEGPIAEAGGSETGTATIVGVDGTKQEITYYTNTKLGILLEKYNLITPEVEANRYADEEATFAMSEFTNSNAYPKEVGLRLKLAELAVTDYTTDGWYVKNGGLTDLPDSIRSRLFNINVSNNVDSVEPEDDTHPYDKKNYVRNINGNYFLTPASADTETNTNYVIYDSGSFYLVQVLEAPSVTKLNIENANSYAKDVTKKHTGASDVLFTENVAIEIAKVLGTKDSYVNNAYASYIEQYSVAYHDSAVYDYFKDKFPELFEDED